MLRELPVLKGSANDGAYSPTVQAEHRAQMYLANAQLHSYCTVDNERMGMERHRELPDVHGTETNRMPSMGSGGKTMTANFNVNENVRVILTDTGRNALRKHWELVYKTRARQEEAMDVCSPGWRTDSPVKFQLWELMSIFGSVIGNGMPVPFQTTILIEIDEALAVKP